VLPSVDFRPIRLAIVCGLAAIVAVGLAAWAGAAMFGVFFGVGLFLGLLNALLVRRSVAVITAQDNPPKSKMALNSATRLLVITVIALAIGYFFRPTGLGALFGLALFQVFLVLSTVLPVYKKLRTGELDGPPAENQIVAAVPFSIFDDSKD